MNLTQDGKALYMHCLPADITDVSCKAGEVSAEVFEQYRIPTYHEATLQAVRHQRAHVPHAHEGPGGEARSHRRSCPEPLPLRGRYVPCRESSRPSNREVRQRTAKRCRERGIVIPTFRQMRDPGLLPESAKAKLKGVGLWDVNPANLFRITWKNDHETGLFGGPNFLEIPREITGVKARVVGLVGKYFPTGAHKVGAAFACLVPRLVSGEFDPEKHKAVWPSTGNYCRGGAFDSAVLGCTAVAILPENMSKERFTWLAADRRPRSSRPRAARAT